MTTRLRSASNRRAAFAGGIAGGIAALAVLLPQAGIATVGPDMTVFSLSAIANYGTADGFAAYAIGISACNRGDTPLNWCNQDSGCAPGAASKDHPVLAQNLYRLRNGRFEQIGMGWLKHEILAANSVTFGCVSVLGQACQSPPAGGRQLGIGCTNASGSSLSGVQPLGLRSEVNATTGFFPFPYTVVGGPYTLYDQRIKVPIADLDPALNPGALYWAEAQYVAPDDAAAGNGFNNASYRRVTVAPAPNFNVITTGSTFERQPAIYGWKRQDPNVILTNADVPGSITERFHVGRTVTDLGGGLWHYEYAVHNLNSDRGARAFKIEFPGTANFTNAGFKDIDSHSGEVYATTDWTVSSSGGLLSWATDTFATDPNANALRFGTMYNFWFDADQPPADAVVHTIELFKSGDPASVSFTLGDGLFADGFESGNITPWTGSGP